MFPTQFALSLELTRLVPPVLSMLSKGAHELMTLARDLQRSGSDIVIEEDLATMFGRSLIDPQMASTFRTVIARHASTKLCENIILEAGPGPTTLRALSKNQTPYFSMVIQCSLLASVLEKSSLAAALKNIFEKQAEDAPRDQPPRPNPSEHGLFGVLQACSEQTSLFNWSNLLFAVAETLGDSDIAHDNIPAVVFRGLATTLPLIQHFPEERMLHIECGEGICLIVVWAHHVLGLSLTVRTWLNGVCTEQRFGSQPAQIFVDARNVVDYKIRAPSVTLLEVSDGETTDNLFRFEPDPDEPKIEALLKKPAKGYGKAVLGSSTVIGNGQEAVLNDMAHVTCAFAILISRSLCASPAEYIIHNYYDDSTSSHSEQNSEGEGQEQATLGDVVESHGGLIPVSVDEDRLVEAGRFLFGIRKLNAKTISQYVAQYTGGPLTSSRLAPPISLTAALDEHGTPRSSADSSEYWRRAIHCAQVLSILILAFTHVHDLESCAELPLNYHYGLLAEHASVNRLCHWDGTSVILITDTIWFHAIASLMVDSSRMQEERPTLLSDRGWSIYLTTIGLEDPSHTDAGYVAIKPGTPHRQGVYKHIIIDGLDKGRLDASAWQLENIAGEKATLDCTNTVTLDRPLCGERRDSFIVSLRMTLSDRGSTYTRRAGYCELYHALWTVQKTKSCEHPLRKKEKVTLAPGFATISGFGDEDLTNLDERILICLTAHSETARWRALLAIAHTRHHHRLVQSNGDTLYHVMLRGKDCCFRCVIAQTSIRSGKWFIVL